MEKTCSPTRQQLDFMSWEIGVFLHFGIRTFYEEHRDWDRKPMDPAGFNPQKLDCRSWARQIKKAGAKYAVMTAKHHDGFALWPSAYTDYSVKNTPWKEGKGDVVRAFTDACREEGLKIGLYYSCAQFSTEEMGGKYNDFVIGQLSELLGNYGKIDIIWFDGCGSDGFDFNSREIYEHIRRKQKDIMIFGGQWGQDIRWIGNEWGCAHIPNSNRTEDGSFAPGECDCCMVRKESENFWFYNETNRDCLRTKEELIGLYYLSVGRGANLLINIGPDRRGLLPEEQVELLESMSLEIDRRFTQCRLPVKRTEVRTMNGKRVYVAELERCMLIDHVLIRENMENSEHIRRFTLGVAPHDSPEDMIEVESGYTVGNKRICRFPVIRGRFVYLVLEDADECASVKELSVCYTECARQISG